MTTPRYAAVRRVLASREAQDDAPEEAYAEYQPWAEALTERLGVRPDIGLRNETSEQTLSSFIASLAPMQRPAAYKLLTRGEGKARVPVYKNLFQLAQDGYTLKINLSIFASPTGFPAQRPSRVQNIMESYEWENRIKERGFYTHFSLYAPDLRSGRLLRGKTEFEYLRFLGVPITVIDFGLSRDIDQDFQSILLAKLLAEKTERGEFFRSVARKAQFVSDGHHETINKTLGTNLVSYDSVMRRL